MKELELPQARSIEIGPGSVTVMTIIVATHGVYNAICHLFNDLSYIVIRTALQIIGSIDNSDDNDNNFFVLQYLLVLTGRDVLI